MGELKEKLVPFQLALGVRGAGAALATLAQGIFEQGRKGRLYCTDQLGLDLKNAFGTVSRVRIHEALREHCPSLMRWFLIAYGGTSPILHSTWGLMDREVEVGIKQGDPLSMLLMAGVMVRPLHVITTTTGATNRCRSLRSLECVVISTVTIFLRIVAEQSLHITK